MVMQQSSSYTAWAEYAAVLLHPDTLAFFAARLPPSELPSEPVQAYSDDGARLPPSVFLGHNHASLGISWTAEDGAIVCETCGCAVPQVSVSVFCLDGSTLSLDVPQRSIVWEVKRTIGRVRDLQPGLMELFLKGTEAPLPDMERLDRLGDVTELFMMQRPGG
jgi:hypothetical protein